MRISAAMLAAACLTVLPFVAADVADIQGLNSPEVRKAEAKFKKEEQKIREKYAKELGEAASDYVRALRKLMARATKAGDLDDAVAIREEIRRLETLDKQLRPKGDPRRELEEKIQGSTWTYGKKQETQDWLTFGPGGQALSGRYGKVRWAAVDGKTAVLLFQNRAVDVFEFERGLGRYACSGSVRPRRADWKGGERLKADRGRKGTSRRILK